MNELEMYKKARDDEYDYIIKLRTPPKRTWLSWIWTFRDEPDTTDLQWAAYQRWRWYNDKVTEFGGKPLSPITTFEE